MTFEWDDVKRRENIGKHGIDFSDVPQIFEGPMLLRLDTRREYDEDRWIGLGFLDPFVVVVVFVERTQNETRIISARKANRHERRTFRQELRNRLGPP